MILVKNLTNIGWHVVSCFHLTLCQILMGALCKRFFTHVRERLDHDGLAEVNKVQALFVKNMTQVANQDYCGPS